MTEEPQPTDPSQPPDPDADAVASPDPEAVAPPDPDADAGASPDPDADPTPPRRPRTTGPVQYKGDDLSAERGPGLGCFRFQLVILVIFILLTPLSVVWDWPEWVSTVLLFSVILLLLLTGQTIIFLLRLVSADRRGRRRPLASETKTVGELEDEDGDFWWRRIRSEAAVRPTGLVKSG